MNQFFTVYLYDVTNNEIIWFSKPDGSFTDIVILDDGWAPTVTKYVRDGEKTWSDVVEELECMTNVDTRDEALELIEKLNALVHRASRDIEEKQAYTVRFCAQSQFSTAQNEAFTHVVSPPDDGNVITLSTDIQTAPPGQVKFKLRFKRTGAWITSFNDTTHNSVLTSDINPPSGYWKLQTTLPTNITIPTPISLAFSFNAGGSFNVSVENVFLCTNVLDTYLVKTFYWDYSFGMNTVSYPISMFAINNEGYVIYDNTNNYTKDKIPFSSINLTNGVYAVFVAWRSVQPDVAHRLQLQFDNNTETRNTLLLSSDTNPHYQYLGTVKTTTTLTRLYLQTTVGNSTGFEIEKILFVKIKTTSSIIDIQNWYFNRDSPVVIENSVVKPIKNIVQLFSSFKELLSTYSNVDTVADSNLFNVFLIGNSPGSYSLRTAIDYYPVETFSATVSYRPIRTIFY